MKIDRLMGFIVSHPKIDHFTVLELRAAYILFCDEEIEANEVRKRIYYELLKLVKKGWLKKQTSKKRNISTYSKTDLFNLDHVEFANGLTSIPETLPKQVTELNEDSLKELSARLNDYKSDLLEGLGEVEEYRSIRDTFPELHEELADKYRNARETNSRVLGKIKAIETLISSKYQTITL